MQQNSCVNNVAQLAHSVGNVCIILHLGEKSILVLKLTFSACLQSQTMLEVVRDQKLL